jgi:hypothetical protein
MMISSGGFDTRVLKAIKTAPTASASEARGEITGTCSA